MDPELSALVFLAIQATIIVAIVIWQMYRTAGSCLVWCLYAALRLVWGTVFHWRSNRHCPFPANGPAIIIANHRSPVDPLLVWMNHHLTGGGRRHIRPIGFLMAREYYELGYLKWLCLAMESIPVERNGKDVGPTREALRRLKAGKLLGVFPEGRINTGDGLLEANTGVAWLALKSRVPVYPVFIVDSPGGKNMVEPFLTPCRVKVIYGDPIDLSSFVNRRKSPQLLQEVTTLLMSRLAELGGVEYSGAASAPRQRESNTASEQDNRQRQDRAPSHPEEVTVNSLT